MSRIAAVLGPTNTGKTHYAIERMLAYRTGVIGLPLRLLAREVYDKIVALRGPSVVALVTGEERIVPERAQYWVCTVEAMPVGLGADFVAVDEIQLCADPERGHVFTDRLLNARGQHETLFMGADTMRGAIAGLVPGVSFLHRERFSALTYSGSKKTSRMPPRSAIVGFSVENLYAIAELMRRQKGGVAVVMGALSPRTRNAQVAMYQNGDVDYLVATDAIGMGLNLDVDHVAFSALAKFDGRRMRQLAPNELAQIAGRAGRYRSDGTFGVTGEARPLDDEVVAAITEHRFTPIRKLNWRNARLTFGSVDALIASLEAGTDDPWLTRAREADDQMALKALAEDAVIRARASDGASVKLLWDVCRVPDFRGISHAEHEAMLSAIFTDLHEHGQVREDWFARQVARIDKTHGDIDALSKRLAFIRTWTYVAQRRGWLADEDHWRGETRAVEDRLSDALHAALTQRFVDRRTSVLLRRLKQKEGLVAEVNDKGEVTIEGEFVGRLEGFRFRQDASASPEEAKTLRAAAVAALAPQFSLKADRFYNAPDTEIDYTEQGGLMWGEHAVGKLVKGDDPLKPQVQAFVDDEAGAEVAEKVARRLQHFVDRKVAALFEPLIGIQKDEKLAGLARGFGFRLIEAMGIIPRDQIAREVKELDQEARGLLRKHGVRFGQFTIFMPALLKPAPTRLRLVLWSLLQGLDEFPEAPPPGLVTIPVVEGVGPEVYALSGYRPAGARAIRIDMLERLADQLRAQDSRGGFEANPDMLSITGMTLEQFADLMQGLGYAAARGERPKTRPADHDAKSSGYSEVEAQPWADRPPEPHPGDHGASEIEAIPEADGAGHSQHLHIDHLEGSGFSSVEAQPDVDDDDEFEPHPGAAGASETDARGPASDEPDVFYTFTWAGFAKPRGGGGAARRPKGGGGGGGKPKGGKPRGKGPKDQPDGKTRSFEARPPKKDKPIDPDNPFAAALMGLRDKT
ncbi:helicase-related protein [Maritimibacter sp. HL-12]|uniref:helicase-related protein n=1 Tax=Maritimibacter sp. HL-12 TaxID=1162418 RepID=UPI000A0F3502|nr:helicase-related protein [Maritimibacter sp. HL-12]SMH54944.1 ATP-dependent RNA helicase SUPV3L1/SUV3 [Maritimibacter sp. HL-12]